MGQYKIGCVSTGESVWVRERVYGCGRECMGAGECVSVRESVHGYGRVYVYKCRSSRKIASCSQAILRASTGDNHLAYP